MNIIIRELLYTTNYTGIDFVLLVNYFLKRSLSRETYIRDAIGRYYEAERLAC